MSLSQEPVFGLLKQSFVVGWKNIVHEAFVGDSLGYACHNVAVGTTNGAGGRNVQLLVLSPDGVVVHGLAGFWHPDDLARELKLGLELNDLWKNESLSPDVAAFADYGRRYYDNNRKAGEQGVPFETSRRLIEHRRKISREKWRRQREAKRTEKAVTVRKR